MALRCFVRLRWFVGCVLIVLFLGACSSGSKGDDVFLEGRKTVTVYEMGVPGDFDKSRALETLGAAFGVKGAVKPFGKKDFGGAFYDIRNALLEPETVDTVGLNFQTWTWFFTRAGTSLDQFCDSCAPVTISEADAIERAKQVLAATGLDPEQLVFSTYTSLFEAGTKYAGQIQSLDVNVLLKIDGVVSDQDYRVTFGDGDKLREATGDAGRPIKLGVVGLLTPLEALAQKYTGRWDGVLDPAVVAKLPSDPSKMVLSYASDFNRQELFEYIIPSYNIPLEGVSDVLPIGPESVIVENVWAIRYEDLPKIP
jgi:hypothetical protein